MVDAEDPVIADPVDSMAGPGVQQRQQPAPRYINQAAIRSQYNFCGKQKPCGHECKGVQGETECLPCMKPEC